MVWPLESASSSATSACAYTVRKGKAPQREKVMSARGTVLWADVIALERLVETSTMTRWVRLG